MNIHVHVPSSVEVRLILCAEIGPALEGLARQFLEDQESIPMTEEELRVYVDGKVQEVKDAVAKETDEVKAAVTAGGNASGGIPDSVKDVLDTAFTAIVESIGGTFVPSDAGTGTGTTPTPTPPTGGPTPTPPAPGTTTPGTNPEPQPVPEPQPTPTPAPGEANPTQSGPPGTSVVSPNPVTSPNAGQPPETTVTPAPGEGQPVPSTAPGATP